MLVACVTLTGQTFEKAQMYVEQEHKPKLRKVAIDVEAEALVVTGKSGKYSSVVRIPYAEITGLEYEKSESTLEDGRAAIRGTKALVRLGAKRKLSSSWTSRMFSRYFPLSSR